MTTLSRRGFLAASAGLALARAAGAQEGQGAQPGQGGASTAFAPMNQGAVRSVKRPAKPGAAPSMTNDERDALERRLHCQCGCSLDIYTCRTTDFACRVSPAMHADVVGLVAGGYLAAEIVDAFVAEYGERVLMAPRKAGFNWTAYLLPFVAIGAGAVVVVRLLRGWSRASAAASAGREAAVAASAAGGASISTGPGGAASVDATPEEWARLQAALRDDR